MGPTAILIPYWKRQFFPPPCLPPHPLQPSPPPTPTPKIHPNHHLNTTIQKHHPRRKRPNLHLHVPHHSYHSWRRKHENAKPQAKEIQILEEAAGLPITQFPPEMMDEGGRGRNDGDGGTTMEKQTKKMKTTHNDDDSGEKATKNEGASDSVTGPNYLTTADEILACKDMTPLDRYFTVSALLGRVRPPLDTLRPTPAWPLLERGHWRQWRRRNRRVRRSWRRLRRLRRLWRVGERMAGRWWMPLIRNRWRSIGGWLGWGLIMRFIPDGRDRVGVGVVVVIVLLLLGGRGGCRWDQLVFHKLWINWGERSVQTLIAIYYAANPQTPPPLVHRLHAPHHLWHQPSPLLLRIGGREITFDDDKYFEEDENRYDSTMHKYGNDKYKGNNVYQSSGWNNGNNQY